MNVNHTETPEIIKLENLWWPIVVFLFLFSIYTYTEFHSQRNFFFFLSSIKLVNYLKTFAPNQHQNDSKICVIKSEAQEHASGYKNAFSVPWRADSKPFMNAHNSNL